jgi:hypothetical protein
MRRRVLAKLGLAAFLVVATALPARAGTTTVNKVDGVNFQYTATDIAPAADPGPGASRVVVYRSGLARLLGHKLQLRQDLSIATIVPTKSSTGTAFA